MSEDKRIQDSQEREKRRRDWAARQNPELVTSLQALEMFGRSNYAGFSDFMKENDVVPVRASGFFSSNFYVKSEVEKLVTRGAMYSQRGRGRPMGSFNSPKSGSGGARVTFESMNDGSWTIEEFLIAWGSTANKDKAEDLFSRAPSLLKLSPVDAFNLILILLNLGGREFRLIGGKVDKRVYVKLVQSVTPDAKERSRLLEIIYALYRSTDIGVFDPQTLVPVLYELMTTNSNRPST